MNGVEVFYNPILGKYSSDDPAVVAAHVDALDYAHVNLGIASWFGRDVNLDRARVTSLLVESRGTNVKWTVYHEMEYLVDQTVAQIRDDLAYIKKWFAWHPSYGHIGGRPVIFVYNEDGYEVASRWMSASKGEWYVVHKLFEGYSAYPDQQNGWHQYGPAVAVSRHRGYSITISPEYWRSDQGTPMLPRLSEAQWRENVLTMVRSNEGWQLITTFNEWGEGTAVEVAREWASASGYGMYLDVLHDIQ